MSAPHEQVFTKHLQGGDMLPVYALVSPSALLLGEAVGTLTHRVLGDNATTLNGATFSGAMAGAVSQALATATTLPWGTPSTKRLVIVSELHKIAAKEQLALLDYLKGPSPTSVLLLTGEKCDMRTKFGLALRKHRCLFCFDMPKPAELPAFVTTRAAAMNTRIDRDASQLLAELCGADLDLLLQSLNKAAMYAGAGQPITTDCVAAVVARTKQASVFELTDAVGARDQSRASILAHRLLTDGESALLLIAMVVRQLRQLLITQRMAQAPLRELCQALGVRPFVAEALLKQAQNFSPAALVDAHAAAAAADRSCKGSRLPHTLIVERLLYTIIHGDCVL